MPTLLIRRRRPVGEAAAAPPQGFAAAVLAGTVGAGRVVALLAGLGVPVAHCTQAVIDPEAPLPALGAAHIGGSFDVVVLGSHLVNNPDPGRRDAFLRLAARHLASDGRLLVEHHPLDWAETAEPTPATPGAALGMVDVQRNPPFVSAVTVYDVGGRIVRQRFTAQVLSEAELDAALATAGFHRVARLGPTVLEARARRPR